MDADSAHQKHKVVLIMGATGCGKSRLSIDLATHCGFSSEIINADKMQLYKGLEITTNKIPLTERNGIPHHLLGDVDPSNGEFTPSDFRLAAANIISDVTERNKVPIVIGGSNSLIHALVVDRFDPGMNVFDDDEAGLVSCDLRYDCCFLWVDVSFPVLSEYLLRRVDDMIEMGMVDELAEFYDPGKVSDLSRVGLRKAIGVPEFDRYFKRFPLGVGSDLVREGAYRDAVRAIKENTCVLARRQIGKILRLKEAGWDLQRVDATAAITAAMAAEKGGERWEEVWERQVAGPSMKIVKRFLMDG